MTIGTLRVKTDEYRCGQTFDSGVAKIIFSLINFNKPQKKGYYIGTMKFRNAAYPVNRAF